MLDNTEVAPPNASEPAQTLAAWTLNPGLWAAGTTRERRLDGDLLQCLETKSNPMSGKSALCFDKTTGVLVAKAGPHGTQSGVVEETCQYGDYQKFGEKTFPRDVRCFDGGKLKLEMRVIELGSLDNAGAELFAQSDGAKETLNCQGLTQPPKAVDAPDPLLPRTETPRHPVVLKATVGTDGKPRDIRVVQSVDRDFDHAAIDAVRRWKFEPAKCDGEPMETQITVDVEFKAQQSY